MDIQTAKQIRIADFLYSLGHSPVKQQGINLWYKSPLREETGTGTLQFRLCALSSTENRGTDTTHTSRVFLFWQAIIFRTEFSAIGHCAAGFSCPACLPTGKRDKHGTGEKRM